MAKHRRHPELLVRLQQHQLMLSGQPLQRLAMLRPIGLANPDEGTDCVEFGLAVLFVQGEFEAQIFKQFLGVGHGQGQGVDVTKGAENGFHLNNLNIQKFFNFFF